MEINILYAIFCATDKIGRWCEYHIIHLNDLINTFINRLYLIYNGKIR